MLVTPGQGILFMLIGVTMVDFPGKHMMMVRMLQRPGVLKMINRIRQRDGKPPLDLPRQFKMQRDEDDLPCDGA